MTTFRKRPGPIRRYILFLITIILLDRIVDVGIDNNEYNYTRTKFEWVMDDYSQFQSIVISAIIIGIYLYKLCFKLSFVMIDCYVLIQRSRNIHPIGGLFQTK